VLRRLRLEDVMRNRPDPTDTEGKARTVDASGELLHALLEAPGVEAHDWGRTTRAGHVVRLRGMGADADERLELFAPGGRLCLTIRLTPDGAQLELDGAELHVRAHERLRLSGSHVEVSAHKTLELRSEGEIVQRARGLATSAAFEHQVEATHGEIRLVANDDIALDGERVRLNSPAAPLPPQVRTRPNPRRDEDAR
jgi:uncharacterized protein (DUF2345 family)